MYIILKYLKYMYICILWNCKKYETVMHTGQTCVYERIFVFLLSKMQKKTQNAIEKSGRE